MINNISSSVHISFKNEHIIYENMIKCTINESQYNLSYNPSLTTDRSGSLIGYTSASYFHPYVTTIGLYNDSNELLAVAKLARPIPISSTTDQTFIIRWDI